MQTLLSLKNKGTDKSQKQKLIGLSSADPPTPPTAVTAFETFFRAIQLTSLPLSPSFSELVMENEQEGWVSTVNELPFIILIA